MLFGLLIIYVRFDKTSVAHNPSLSHREISGPCSLKCSEEMTRARQKNESLERQIKLLKEENKVYLSYIVY